MQSVSATEGAIWSRLLQAGEALTAEGASCILRLEFTPDDKARMRALAAKARAGSLSNEEEEAIRSYEMVGNLLALMKSMARRVAG